MLKYKNQLLAVLLSALLVTDLHAAEGGKTITLVGGLVEVKTVCIDGKLFAVAQSVRGLALQQIFKRTQFNLNPPQPVACKSN